MGDVREAIGFAVRNLRHAGLDAVREFVSLSVHSVRSTTDPDPVIDAEWDVLVVLDACRADLFRSVVEDGEFDLQVGETRTSPASSSKRWLSTVFGDASDATLADLAYVTGNPFSATHIDETRFASVDEVWRDGWDDDAGTIPADPITAAAIDRWRSGDADRMVVHYMQPHFPSLGAPAGGADGQGVDDGIELDAFGDRSLSVWEDLRCGHRTREAVWADYRANLEYVLESVESLLAGIDAERVVLTADHGNAFGERYVHGHPSGVDIPCLREVPWSVTSGRGDGSEAPDPDDLVDLNEESLASEVGAGSGDSEGSDDGAAPSDVVEDRLEQLGYRR